MKRGTAIGVAAPFGSPAEERMAELLSEAGLWYTPQQQLGHYRLDFLVVGPCGGRYDVEVDGRQHLTDEGIRSDGIRDAAVAAAGMRVLRISARKVFAQEDRVRAILGRLV